MNARPQSLRVWFTRWLTLLALAMAAIAANAQSDPPARVAALSHIEGSVAFASAGETEWSAATLNRPITRGDRLWTDPGGRAEVHLGSAALQLASQTFVEMMALDDDVLQLTLNEGTVNARVRQLEGGENFEVTTPQLAFRATQPGEYRIDVDPQAGFTRVTVRSGLAMIYGAGNGVLQLRGGQQMAFSGRDLAAVAVPSPVEDAFDRWAADRNRAEDQSVSARYVPREVVGYQELDAYGAWSQDANYGAVWYPNITIADWAPYRYGRWEWIAPWGWTWIDDARWGFAPFHYGRWAHIGSRWAWVPGRIERHPVYAPALVAFVGGAGANWNLPVGSGSGIGWFPLAPGEAWRPTYRASTFYLRNANRNAVFSNSGGFFFQHRPEAITAVRIEDFNRGRPVHQHWSRVNAGEVGRLQVNAQPVLPQPRSSAEMTARTGQPGPRPQMQFVPPVQPAVSQRLAPRPQEEQRHAPQVRQVQQAQRQRPDQQRAAARQPQQRVQRPQQQAVQQARVPRQPQRAQGRAAAPQHQLPPRAAAAAQDRGRGRQREQRDAHASEDGARGRGRFN